MRRFEGHQQGETKLDEAVFTESAAVKASYVWSRLSTPSRHNRANETFVLVGNSVFKLSLGLEPNGRRRPQYLGA